MNLNKAIVVGRMARDPSLKTFPDGNSVCSFSVATNKTYTDSDGKKIDSAQFHNIVAFGKNAENCNKYLVKGMLVMVEGSMKTRSWDNNDGSKAYMTEIVAQFVQFGPKAVKSPRTNDEPEDGSFHAMAEKGTTRASKQSVATDKIEYPTDDINPEDIPF